MPGRQRFAVHADGQDGVATVIQQRGGKSGGPVVDRATDHLVGPVLHAGTLEQVHQRHAGPDGVADQVAADPIRYARQRHDVFLEIHRQDLVEGQLVGMVDHASEGELPIRRVDLGHGQRRVDPVELVVGRHVAGDAGDLVERVQRCDLGGDRGSGRSGRRGFDRGRSAARCRCRGGPGGAQVDAGSGGLRRRRAAHATPQRHQSDRGNTGTADAEQELAAAGIWCTVRPVTAHGRWVALSIRRFGWCLSVGAGGSEPHQDPQRRIAKRCGGQGHDPRTHERAHRVAGGGPAADEAECGEPREGHPSASRRHGAGAQQAADDQRNADDADRQHRLVFLAEELDAQLDGPVGGVIDQCLADGHHQRRDGVHQPVDELAERECHGCAGDAGQQAHTGTWPADQPPHAASA